MNIVIIPFHDWRKIIKEGFRTRDAHFIEVLFQRKRHKKIIINRPITMMEIFLKKKKRLIDGNLLLKKNGFALYEVEKNTFLIDFISINIFKQILQKYKWYINNYSNKKYLSFIQECLSFLEVEDYNLLNQNVFAYKLTKKLKPEVQVFDAWDDFIKFKVYKSIKEEINIGYQTLAKNSSFWVTNARENIESFKKRYYPKSIHLINNGVDLKRFVFNTNEKTPKDLNKIKKPIVGFGGKITQLLDTALINKIIKDTPEVSFVFVGQILDKEIFNKINKRSNFYYLGDKHYDIYPNYVKNFDICIVPYVTLDEEKSGANSIKVYEYLATGKKVVGTYGNGLEELEEYVFLARNASEFSEELQSLENNKDKIDLNHHSWENKVNDLFKLINDEANN